MTAGPTKGNCGNCRYEIPDDCDWGPEHHYCGNSASVWNTYLTPDTQTCEHFASRLSTEKEEQR